LFRYPVGKQELPHTICLYKKSNYEYWFDFNRE
jgi:hypothetical protein